jgi:hypothetical protein
MTAFALFAGFAFPLLAVGFVVWCCERHGQTWGRQTGGRR